MPRHINKVRPTAWFFDGGPVTENAVNLVRTTPSYAWHADNALFDITTTDLSIEAWVNATSAPDAGGERHPILSKWGGGIQKSYTFSYALLSDQLLVELQTQDNSPSLYGERWIKTLTVGEWFHLAIAWDTDGATGEHGTLWIDTVDQGAPDFNSSTNRTNIFNSSSVFSLGWNNQLSGWDGKLFDVRFWSGQITGPQVAANWKTIQDPATANLIGNWYVGNVDHDDYSDSNLDLTPVNTPTFTTPGPY